MIDDQGEVFLQRLKALCEAKITDFCPPTERAVASVREIIPRVLAMRQDICRPRLFPTREGGFEAEWNGRWYVTMEFKPDGTIELDWSLDAWTTCLSTYVSNVEDVLVFFPARASRSGATR